jgi:hypothetical protein
VEEIIAVMRAAGDTLDGVRLRAVIVVLWRAGLRISEALALSETDLDPDRGALLGRRGKGWQATEVGMDRWGWVPTLENAATHPRSSEVGVEYVAADESATVAEHDPFATDPDVVERGTRSHACLQNQLAAEAASAGLVPLSPAADDPPFDIAWRDGAELHVAEVKSTTATNEEHQLRLGLGQLLRYRHARSADGKTVHATLYVEREPVDSAWSQLCQSLGITLRWPTL